MRCNNCGKENSEGKFCAYCGCELQRDKNKINNKKIIIIIASIIVVAFAAIAGIVLFNVLKNSKDDHSEKSEQLQQEESTDYYVVKPVEETTMNSTHKPTENITEKPTEKQTEKVAAKPTEKQMEKATEEPKENLELEFSYENQEIDLGTSCFVLCISNVDLDDCDISSSGDKCFKIYIQNDRYQMIAFGEGEETFNITAPDGRTGTFTLSSIVNEQILDDPSWYCNTMVPFQSVDGKTRNQLTIDKFENGHVVFHIQQGSQNRPYSPHAEGDIYDENKMIFDCQDDYGNKYKGFMEFDKYSIYLRLELVKKSDYPDDATLECDCRLLAVS